MSENKAGRSVVDAVVIASSTGDGDADLDADNDDDDDGNNNDDNNNATVAPAVVSEQVAAIVDRPLSMRLFFQQRPAQYSAVGFGLTALFACSQCVVERSARSRRSPSDSR